MSKQRQVKAANAVHRTPVTGRNVIAAIGIDGYEHWPRLTNAVSDAHGASALFARVGFEPIVEPLIDGAATGNALQQLVMDDLRSLRPEDSVVLFYAGHGGTRPHEIGGQVIRTGYLIPVDASTKTATWIELDGWLRAVSLLPARHILVILDACHSGIALGQIIKWRDAATFRSTPLSALQERRSRRIITSALYDQLALDSGPVAGHSLFTGCLIEALTYGLDRSVGRVTTGSELGLHLQRRVATYPQSRQTPDFGTFDFDERGEMVIPLLTEGVVRAEDAEDAEDIGSSNEPVDEPGTTTSAERQLEEMLDSAPNELPLREFLERHPSILAKSVGISMPGSSDVRTRVKLATLQLDFAVGTYQPTLGRWEWLLVKLASPQDQLFTEDGDPSPPLGRALREVMEWRAWIQHNLTSARAVLPDIAPSCTSTIIMSRRRRVSEANRERLRMLHIQLSNIRITTCDSLLDAAHHYASTEES